MAFAVCLVIVIIWLLWRDSAPVRSLEHEVQALRHELAEQARRHAEDMGRVNAKMQLLEEENVRQRSMKHKVTGDLAKTVIALELVRRLAEECTCKVLSPLEEIINKLLDDLETFRTADGG